MGITETAERIARESYGKLLAILAARTGDVAGAEDALADAFAAALAEWPSRGAPGNPEGWLLTVARRRQIDAVRRCRTADEAGTTVAVLAEELAVRLNMADEIPDERLRLMFVCAHPAIEARVRAPLMLQTVLGFDAAKIASAFLVSPATMGQRLVRAKSRIRHARIPFRIPNRDELAERLEAVLEAVYLIYTESWSDPAGTQPKTRGLAAEALWLGRLLVDLLPAEPETLGLLALMLHAEARREARRNEEGEFVPLDRQDPARWNSAAIDEAEGLLWRASRAGCIGRFQLQAAVQSVHATRRVSGVTDWAAIVELYDVLLQLTDSVVIAVNRAVALAHAENPAVGSAALDALHGDARLANYQPYWAARAALLPADRAAEATQAYQRAIALESDPAVRRFLERQLARVEPTP